ncbi:MAG TPA: MtnX-like HAD-IB family phosphatase [Lachnospiraceae bacterium]|nr:MtnX-like HAD-IB family phosphatase [Lachnospiraceae bacterium]
MKKPYVFISDFDGTLSTKDFYQIIMDEYLGDEGKRLFEDWKAGKYMDKDFLNKIYSSINRNEEEIMEDIMRIQLDDGANDFIDHVKTSGGEFVIASAGTSYYIERLLEKYQIRDVKVYSNPGVYKDRGIHLQIDPSDKYYSKRYGIDKAKIVEEYKKKYQKVFYAGDSQPDVAACKIADIAFAKSKLIDLLESEGVPCIPVLTYQDIEDYLRKEGVLY